MTPATINQLAAGALARASQSPDSDDATAQGGTFDAVLADLAQQGEDVEVTGGASGEARTPVPAKPAAQTSHSGQQDVRALLLQMSSGAALPAANAGAALASEKTAARTSDRAGSSNGQTKDATSKKAESRDDATTDMAATTNATTNLAASAVANPSAAGLVPMPGAVAGSPATAPKDGNATSVKTRPPTAGSSSVALPGTADAPGRTAAADVEASPPIGVAIIGQASHLAPSVASGGLPLTAEKGVTRSRMGAAASAAATSVDDDTTAGTAARPTTPASPLAATDDAARSPQLVESAGSAHRSSAKPSAASADADDAAVTGTATVRDASAQPDAALPAVTLQAIASAVASLADDTGDAPAPAPTPQSAPAPASIAPARSLTLQLSPGSLGAVTVHLHMTSGGLDLRLSVENDRTLGALTHARDELGAAIGGTGTKLESLIIQSAPASATAGSNDTPRSQSDTPAGGFANQSGDHGSGGGSDRHTRQGGSAPARPPAAAARDRGGDGIFV